MTNTAINPLESFDDIAIRDEARVVLRTVDQITTDLDTFSAAIRKAHRTDTVIEATEHHLALARRNCAEATRIATELLTLEQPFTTVHSELVRDAFACLGLADSAYLRAFETAGPS